MRFAVVLGVTFFVVTLAGVFTFVGVGKWTWSLNNASIAKNTHDKTPICFCPKLDNFYCRERETFVKRLLSFLMIFIIFCIYSLHICKKSKNIFISSVSVESEYRLLLAITSVSAIVCLVLMERIRLFSTDSARSDSTSISDIEPRICEMIRISSSTLRRSSLSLISRSRSRSTPM